MAEAAACSDEASSPETAYDPHVCEYCGKALSDPGLAFLIHLDESETCRWLWRAYLPYVHEDAGEN